MKKIKIVLMLLLGVIITSCESSTYNDISVAVTNPTYTKNIEPIIKSNCTGCHSGGSQFPNLGTYAEVKQATQNGSLICRIDQTQACGSVMPPSGAMSKQTVDMIKLWQQQGFVN